MTPIQVDKRLIAAGVGVAAVGAAMICILKTKGFMSIIKPFLDNCKVNIFRCNHKNVHHHAHSHKSDATVGVRPQPLPQQRGYTVEELMEYNGVNNERILVSLQRKVYEVGKSLYGPGAPYHVFAGKEASRCVAKSVLDDKEANKYWSDCTEEELQALDEHVALFERKYPVVGWFIPNDNFYEF